MLFTRVASFLVAFFALGFIVSATPVEGEKRAVTAQTIVNNLQTQVNSITTQLRTFNHLILLCEWLTDIVGLEALNVNTPTNALQAQTLVDQLVVAIDEAKAQSAGASLEKRDNDPIADAVADTIAVIVTVSFSM